MDMRWGTPRTDHRGELIIAGLSDISQDLRCQRWKPEGAGKQGWRGGWQAIHTTPWLVFPGCRRVCPHAGENSCWGCEFVPVPVSHFRSSLLPLFRFQSHLPLCIRPASVTGGALPQEGRQFGEMSWGEFRHPRPPSRAPKPAAAH